MISLGQLPESLGDGIIQLDAHRIEDAEAHLVGEDDEMRRRFDAARPATLEETRTAIERWLAGRAVGGPIFAYALRMRSGCLIGGCELQVRSEDSASISYWVFRPFRGQGYASRAIDLLCAAAARVSALKRLEIRIATDNQPSLRVAEKAGFFKIGSVVEKGPTGADSTMVLYAKNIT